MPNSWPDQPPAWFDRGVRDGLIPQPWADEARTEYIPRYESPRRCRVGSPLDSPFWAGVAIAIVLAGMGVVFGLILAAAQVSGT